MRKTIIVLSMLWGAAVSAVAQVSIGVQVPGLSIGINMPVYPTLVRVPNYPVYYAPGAESNFFFYDGMYWVYQDDNWYASSWYNGPWGAVEPAYVPLYVLRVPVRYYRSPPVYFRGWRADAPPRWGDHWGRDWEQNRRGWDRWDRRAAPAPAPLPSYQRRFNGERYPQAEQQPGLHGQNYRYQPRDSVVRQYYQTQQLSPRQANPQRQDPQRGGGDEAQRPGPAPHRNQAAPEPQRAQQPVQREREPSRAEPPRAAPPDRQVPQPPKRGREQDRDQGREQGRDEERGQGRNRQ